MLPPLMLMPLLLLIIARRRYAYACRDAASMPLFSLIFSMLPLIIIFLRHYDAADFRHFGFLRRFALFSLPTTPDYFLILFDFFADY